MCHTKQEKEHNILNKINSIVQSEINLDNNIYDDNNEIKNISDEYNNFNNFNQLNDRYIKEQMKILQNEEKDFIYCTQTEFTPITSTGGLEIKLTMPEKVAGGIFSKSYISYLMETNPFGFKVRKRYSDFEWLNNILNMIYVGCVILNKRKNIIFLIK